MLAATTWVVFLLVALLGYVLIRAARIGRIWFIVIDPARAEHPALFWYCVVGTLAAFLGGAFALFVLMSALVLESR